MGSGNGKRINRRDVKETQSFKNLSAMLQKITLHRTNIKCIQDGVLIASNIGYQNWEKMTSAKWSNQQIVKEFIEKQVKD